MIKAGIYGPSTNESALRKQLLRLLLRHPDVDLRAVAAPGATGIPLAAIHPVYTGETELRLESVVDVDALDVLFVIGEDMLTPDAIRKLDEDPEFRVIVLGRAPMLRADHGRFEPGFAEWNRKALVRGARAAVSPSAEALLMATALFPLAKNWLLGADVEAVVSAGAETEDSPAEATALLKAVQGSFDAAIKLARKGAATYERLDLTVEMPLPASVERIIENYREAYSDHGFVYIIPGTDGIDEDLRGSNKCLLQIFSRGDRLVVNASADILTRGNAGNAVHLMNLLFGLQERTGLSI